MTEAQAAEESTSTAVVNADDSISSSDSATLADYASETIELITTMSDAEMEEIVNPSSLKRTAGIFRSSSGVLAGRER